MESSLSEASPSSSSRPEPSSEAHPLNSTPISSSWKISTGSGPFTVNFNSQTLVVLAMPEVLHCRFIEQNGTEHRFNVTVQSGESDPNLTLKWTAQGKNQGKLKEACRRFPQDIPRETSWERVFQQCLNVLGKCFGTPSTSNVLKPPESQGNSNAAQSFGQSGQSGNLMMEDGEHQSPLPAQPTDEVSPSPSVNQAGPNVAEPGDPHAPATPQSSNGVAQGQDIPQIPVANIPSGATDQAVDANGEPTVPGTELRRSKRNTRPPRRLATPPQTPPKRKRPAARTKTSGDSGKKTRDNRTERVQTPYHDDDYGMIDDHVEETIEHSDDENRGEPSRTTSGAVPSVGANGQVSASSIAEKVVSNLTPLLKDFFEDLKKGLKEERNLFKKELATDRNLFKKELATDRTLFMNKLNELLAPRAHSEAAVSPRVSTPSDVQEDQSEDRE